MSEMTENDEREYRDALYTQLREATGRVVYTYTTYLKKLNRAEKNCKRLKRAQIVLSAASTTGFIGTIVTSERWAAVLGGLCSVALLVINLVFRDLDPNTDIKACFNASNELWMIRENYISLLTDFESMDLKEIRVRRDELQAQVFEIYKKYPKTDSKSYEEARKALKSGEEQYFSAEEIDALLPKQLRITEIEN